MITKDEYKALDNQEKIDYLQKTLDTQIAYANELEIQMDDKEMENKTLKERINELEASLLELKAE